MTLEDEVRQCLNGIVDPCSSAAGAPAGLLDMGLVKRIDVESTPSGAHVAVTVTVTEPSCLMGGPFAEEARSRLSSLEGVSSVEVEIDPLIDWTPANMTAEYRARLHDVRSGRHPVPVQLQAPSLRAGVRT